MLMRYSTAARLTTQMRPGCIKGERGTWNLHQGSQEGKSRLKSAHPALKTERRSNVCLSPTSTKTALDRAERMGSWSVGSWHDSRGRFSGVDEEVVVCSSTVGRGREDQMGKKCPFRSYSWPGSSARFVLG